MCKLWITYHPKENDFCTKKHNSYPRLHVSDKSTNETKK